MSLSRNIKRALALGGVTLSLVVVAPASAQAASATAYTSPSRYGNASFNTSTGVLTIRDTNADGYRIVATVWNMTYGLGLDIADGEDANGSNNTPGYATAYRGSYYSGNELVIEVCRLDVSNGGGYQSCGSTSFIV
ncbi:hypothetical protein V6V47_16430 [Micromonospora sp. CPCC 205539]|uniref:hypothetical protein n=1 Tax=Micromonospora sp. CPCC 205539 TaxID=3122408 RepID=UPI002FEFEC53